MTPPRHESDTLRDDEKTPTRMRTPAEDSQVQEIERIHEQQFGRIESLLQQWDERVASRIASVESKAEQTSVTLFRAVPRRWRLAAVLGTLIGTAGAGSAGTAWSAYEKLREDAAAEALEQRARNELDAATRSHLASPHVDPNAAADLAIQFDQLGKRLDEIDSKLERLEHKRGR